MSDDDTPKHWPIFEDGGQHMAHVVCERNQSEESSFDLWAGDAPTPCPHCGALVRLIWNVRVEEETAE